MSIIDGFGAAVVCDFVSLLVVVVFRKEEEDEVGWILDVVNGFGAAYFVRSFVTLV